MLGRTTACVILSASLLSLIAACGDGDSGNAWVPPLSDAGDSSVSPDGSLGGSGGDASVSNGGAAGVAQGGSGQGGQTQDAETSEGSLPDGAVPVPDDASWPDDAGWADGGGGLEDATTVYQLACDVLVVGGGLGAVAAAHEAASAGAHTCIVAPGQWLGGQLTSQGTPPDEYFYYFSKTYASVRDGIRSYYKANYQVKPSALGNDTELGQTVFDPGSCWVSALCHEPKVALHVINELLAPLEANGKLQIIRNQSPSGVLRSGSTVTGVGFTSNNGTPPLVVTAQQTIDASELGDLFPLAGAAYRVGGESKSETNEPDAPTNAAPGCVQPVTVVFAMERRPEGENHRIAQPPHYDPGLYGLWGQWAGHFFSPSGWSFWDYRRMLAAANFSAGVPNDIAIINWGADGDGNPGGNDFDRACGPDGCNLLDQTPAAQTAILQRAREHALGFVYWMQTDVPRDDGSGKGYPNLKLRGDVFDTPDGLSPEPYIREARRLKAVTLIREQDVRKRAGGDRAEVHYDDTVGIARYAFDLHGCAGGPAYPITQKPGKAEIPLGSLIPEQLDGLLAGAKNLGVTKISNGMYRLHPSEWNIGQAAGAAAALAIEKGVSVRQVRQDAALLRKLQHRLISQRGGPIFWWEDVDRSSYMWTAAQMMGASGVMLGWDHMSFYPDQEVTRAQAAALIVREFGIPVVTDCHPSFTDVPCSNPYYGYVQALADRGVTAGVGGGLYSPDPVISRAQFATFMVRAACDPKWDEAQCPLTKPASASFSDVPASSIYYGYVETAKARGWFAGDGTGLFKPDDPLPRGQAAVALFNHMKGWAGL